MVPNNVFGTEKKKKKKKKKKKFRKNTEGVCTFEPKEEPPTYTKTF